VVLPAESCELSKTKPSGTLISWILYDFGMAWFSMVILTAYFILYFKEVVVGGDKGYGDFLWGTTVSIAMLLAVVLSPILGAVADMRGNKKQFLIGFAGLSIISTILLYFTGPGQVFMAMLLVVTGYTGYTVATTFYNAFLPEIAGTGSVEKISGIGWGMGYIGGLAALICMAVMVPSVARGKPILLLAGVMCAIFAIPSFVVLKDFPKTSGTAPASMKDGLLRILVTFKEIRAFRKIFLFLLGYFFVNDAISTVIVFFSSYTVDTLHFSVRENVLLLMIIQLSAAAGSIITGLIAERIGVLETVILTIVVWVGAVLGIFAFSSTSAFCVLSVCAGVVLGGTQATARTFMARESPAEKQNEFFGFMTFGSKVAAIFGPFFYGLVSDQTNNPRIAILSLEVFFIIGLIIMLKVPRTPMRATGKPPA
jgi:UMF1 family MFS transporter